MYSYISKLSIPALIYAYSCWVSTDGGTIWAFVGPMLLIVLVKCLSDLLYSLSLLFIKGEHYYFNHGVASFV